MLLAVAWDIHGAAASPHVLPGLPHSIEPWFRGRASEEGTSQEKAVLPVT